MYENKSKSKNTKPKKDKKEPTLDVIHKVIKKNVGSIKVVSKKGSKVRN